MSKNKNFNKIVAVVAILLFVAKGKAENSISLNRNKINQMMIAIRGNVTLNPVVLQQILASEKSNLEFGLNVPLTNTEYLEIRKLVRDLVGLNVGIDFVSINEMHTSTQEFAAKPQK